jgi:protein-S-isoprenylcysteine O-methyltransferase Ste14
VVLGQALFHRSTALVAYLLGFALFVHLAVVFYEEPTLRRKFGEDYAAYLREVPRWLPRRTHRR